MIIRPEAKQDYYENENLTREAFWDVYRPGCSEHLVLNKLRNADSYIPALVLVAEDGGRLVGNIAYAKMYRDNAICDEIIGFGPVSVLPEYQRQGIGSQLIEETMKTAKAMGFKAVMITGDCGYYGRFGFVPASRYGVHLEGVPLDDEAPFFMAKELEDGYLSEHGGVYSFDTAYNVTQEELDEFEKQFPKKQKREPREGDLI